MKKLFFVVVSIIIWLLNSSCSAEGPVSKEKAVVLAQQFIIENGYTNLPGDESKISYELMEGGTSPEEIYAARKNTLHPLAYYFSENETEWHIGFLSTKVDVTKLSESDWKTDLEGRAVVVSKKDGKAHIAHKDPLYSHFKKL